MVSMHTKGIKKMQQIQNKVETALLGGGCFWCLEAPFQTIEGVIKVTSGYAGGKEADANYEAVCSGQTAHVEVIQIAFDASMISYEKLLNFFFALHDPTSKNRQGNDVGTQYRSVIFTLSEAQKKSAEEVILSLQNAKTFALPIVTSIENAPHFYAAEDYHQNYYVKNPQNGYCQAIISPKLAKLRALLK